MLSVKVRAWEQAQSDGTLASLPGICKHELQGRAQLFSWPPCFPKADISRPSSNTAQQILALPDSQSHIIGLELDPRVLCPSPCSIAAFEDEITEVAIGESAIDPSTWQQIQCRAARLHSVFILFEAAKRDNAASHSSRAVSSRALMDSSGFKRWFSGVRRLIGKQVPEECTETLAVLREAKRSRVPAEGGSTAPVTSKAAATTSLTATVAYVTWEEVIRLDQAAEAAAAAAAAAAAEAASNAAAAAAAAAVANAAVAGAAAPAGAALVVSESADVILRPKDGSTTENQEVSISFHEDVDVDLVARRQLEEDRLREKYTNYRNEGLALSTEIELFTGVVQMRSATKSMISSSKPLEPTEGQLSSTCTSALLVHIAGLGAETALRCYAKLVRGHEEHDDFSDEELQTQKYVLEYAERAAALGELATSGASGVSETFLTAAPQLSTAGGDVPPISIPTEDEPATPQPKGWREKTPRRQWSIASWDGDETEVNAEITVPVQVAISLSVSNQSSQMNIRAHPLKGAHPETALQLSTPTAASNEHLKPTPAARHDVQPDTPQQSSSLSVVKTFERTFGASTIAGSSKASAQVPPLFEAAIPLTLEGSGIILTDTAADDEGGTSKTTAQRVLALMMQCLPFQQQGPAGAVSRAAESYMQGYGDEARDVACTLELVKSLVSWFAIPLNPSHWLASHGSNVLAGSRRGSLFLADCRIVFSIRVSPLSPLVIAMKCHQMLETALRRLQENGGYFGQGVSHTTLSEANHNDGAMSRQQLKRRNLQVGVAAVRQTLSCLRSAMPLGESPAGGGIREWRRQMAPLNALRKRLVECMKRIRIFQLETEVNDVYQGSDVPLSLSTSESAQTVLSSLGSKSGEKLDATDFPLIYLEQALMDALAKEMNLAFWPGGQNVPTEENITFSSNNSTSTYRVVLGDVFGDDHALPTTPSTRSTHTTNTRTAGDHSSSTRQQEWQYLAELGVERAYINEKRRQMLLEEQLEAKERRRASRSSGSSMAAATKKGKSGRGANAFAKAPRFDRMARDIERIHLNLKLNKNKAARPESRTK